MIACDIADLVYDRICGTSSDIIVSIDDMIEEGEIDRDFYKANELDILSIIDSLMFNCIRCGWTVDICDLSTESSIVDLVCVDCEDDDSQ